MYLTYTSRMMECRQDGYEEGLHTGREEGAYQKALEAAKTMISIGLPEEQIQLCTNLPVETVRELEREVNPNP